MKAVKNNNNALKYLYEAKQYEPEQPLIIYHLAMAQLAIKDVKNALRNLERARKILKFNLTRTN